MSFNNKELIEIYSLTFLLSDLFGFSKLIVEMIQQVPHEDQPITVQEEKELRRVFDHLADFKTKLRLNAELLELKQHMTMARIRGNMSANGEPGANSRKDHNETRLDELTREIVALDMNSGNKKITVADVFEKLKDLNQKVTRKDVEEIIWEVDENLDSALDWNEFKLMFTRSISDKSGLEPSRMVSACFLSLRCLLFNRSY